MKDTLAYFAGMFAIAAGDVGIILGIHPHNDLLIVLGGAIQGLVVLALVLRRP